MSTTEQAVVEKLPESNAAPENVSALDSLFEERDAIKTSEPVEKSVKKEEKSSPEKKANRDEPSLEKKEKSEEKTKVVKTEFVDGEDGDEDSRTVEVEKLKKALNDSQKWGHTN